MIIGLSWAELQACRHWGTERHRKHLAEHRSRTPKGSHEVAMPAIAWDTLGERLIREAFHASGRHRKTRNAADGVSATRQAAQKIERSLASLRMHPALNGQASVGTSGEILIAWREPSGKWSPYPIPGVAPSFLVPRYAEAAGVGVVTTWIAHDVPPVEVPELFPEPSDHDLWT